MAKNSKYVEDHFVPVKNINNGVIILDNNLIVSGIKIMPKNIFILEQGLQDSIINNLKDVYNQIDYEFWLIVADRPVDINVYVSQLELLYNSVQSPFKRKMIKEDINKANMFTKNNVVDTEYFILFKHKDNEIVSKRIRTLINAFANAGLTASQTTNDDLRTILDNFLNGGQTTELGRVIMIGIKSQLAPKGLEFRPSDFVISDKHSTIMTVISYPRFISPGYLANLTSMSGIKVVVKHIPLPFSVIQKMINKEIADLKERYQNENDKTIQERIRLDIESLDGFVSMLAASQSKIYDFQMHIMINADNEEQLVQRKIQVKNYLEAMEMRAVSLRFEQEKVFKSIIPIYPNQEIEERIGTPIPSPTIAAMYPFIFDSIKDPGLSTLLGVDFSGGVILFNQFLYQTKKEHNRNNANLIILGTSGSGKSTAAKLLLRSHIRNDYKVVVIDPEGELDDMVATMGGDFIDLGKGGEYGMINPLEVIMDADEEEIKQGLGYTVLTRTLQTLKAFIKYYDPSIEEDVVTMFSETVQDTYKRFGVDFNSDFSKFKSTDYPTFKDVYATIRGRLMSMSEKTHEKDILEKLELKVRPIVKELKYYFDGHTTISPKSGFIVFNIRELMNADKNIRNALFFNILKYAWGLTLDKNVNTVLAVDEAHILLSGNNTLGADFLAQVQRRARKYNTGTIFITQQPSDFSDPSVITQGKAIFDNASYYLVMGLKKQAVEDLSQLIDLNENEIESIKRYNQGEALFVCGSRRMRINVIVTDEELESFGSGGGL